MLKVLEVARGEAKKARKLHHKEYDPKELVEKDGVVEEGEEAIEEEEREEEGDADQESEEESEEEKEDADEGDDYVPDTSTGGESEDTYESGQEDVKGKTNKDESKEKEKTQGKGGERKGESEAGRKKRMGQAVKEGVQKVEAKAKQVADARRKAFAVQRPKASEEQKVGTSVTVLTPSVHSVISPEKNQSTSGGKKEKHIKMEEVKPEKLVARQDNRLQVIVGMEGYRMMCKVAMPLQNKDTLALDDRVWSGTGALFTAVKVRKDSYNNMQHQTVARPKEAYLMVAPADTGEEPSSRVVFVPGTKSCPVMYAGDGRKLMYFANMEKEITEYDETSVPVPMTINNLGMTYPTEFANACASKLDAVYLVREMQLRMADAQVALIKAVQRVQLHPVCVVPTAGVYDEVPTMVKKSMEGGPMLSYVSMDCLPMGEIVGTSKLILKHTWVQDGLLKEARRNQDGEVMILLGMPPAHREEEMVLKMEQQFDVGMLIMSPKMAKKKVDGWVQMVRMDLPVGSLKAWGMRDRYSVAHSKPLGQQFEKSLVLYMKEPVVAALEASAEENLRKEKRKGSKKRSKQSGGEGKVKRSKKETGGSATGAKRAAAEMTEGAEEAAEDEWVVTPDGTRSFSMKTGEVYQWEGEDWVQVMGDNAFKSPEPTRGMRCEQAKKESKATGAGGAEKPKGQGAAKRKSKHGPLKRSLVVAPGRLKQVKRRVMKAAKRAENATASTELALKETGE
jgi:hypothetical protein